MPKFSKEQLKQRLTPLQYTVTQQNGTEPSFKNQYHDCHKTGVYNCRICGKPLFNSELKFDSKTGWPSFYDEIPQANILKKVDKKFGLPKTQVRCSQCDSHLGHLFHDGPKNKTGLRYCINSASIKLQQKNDLS